MNTNIKVDDILIVIGNDKMSNNLANKIKRSEKKIKILKDKSLDLKKLIKLFTKSEQKSLIFFIISILNEARRKNIRVKNIESFKNKNELNLVLSKLNPKLILVFRASLIFPKEIVENFEIINFHCADITDEMYRGLGAIYRSFKAKEKNPKVSAHKMVSKVDEGKIIFQSKYNFDFSKSYFYNENLAFQSGINAIIQYIKNIEK